MELFKTIIQGVGYLIVATVVAFAWYYVIRLFNVGNTFIGGAIMLIPLEAVIFFCASILSPILFVVYIFRIVSSTTELERSAWKVMALFAAMVFSFQIYGFYNFGYIEATKIMTVILVATFQYVWFCYLNGHMKKF